MRRFLYRREIRLTSFCVAGLFLVQAWIEGARAEMLYSFPRVSRGAYLQSGGPDTIVVRWRTPQATSSVVRYGFDPEHLTEVAGHGARLRDHVIRLTGLLPNTRYFYSVGTTNRTFQKGPSNFFVTAPAPGAAPPIRIWVLGDPGTASPVQRAVRDAYQRVSGRRRTDLILTLGDNAYRSGTDFQYQRAIFEVYREALKHTVIWPALGNHDARSANSSTESGVYYDIFTLPKRAEAGGVPSGTEEYYSFDYANAHFICLNSEDSDLAPTGQMLTWLKQDLAANQRSWTIAYWHHPPYSKGSHDSDDPKANDKRMADMREKVVPVIEAAGVDLVLCGHTHLYERSFLLNGYYGASASLRTEMILNKGDGRVEGDGPYDKTRKGSAQRAVGTVYVNSGSAGHATKPEDLHGLNHPAMAIALNVPGSFVLEIDGPRLAGTFLDDHGLARDRFAIQKDP